MNHTNHAEEDDEDDVLRDDHASTTIPSITTLVAASVACADEDDVVGLSDDGTPVTSHTHDATLLTLDDVRREKERLAAEPSIDKINAIAIERIVHAMERIVMRAEHAAAREADDLRRRVELLEFEKKHTSLLEQTQTENAQLKQLLAQAQQQAAASSKRR